MGNTRYQNGFSIMEVLVALSVLAIVLANILPTFAFQLKQNTKAEIRTAALQAGQRAIDELRFVTTTTMPSSGAGTAQTITVDGRDFTVTPYYCLRSSYCTSTSARHITVRVVYKGTQVYETETVFTNFQ